jgi:hypothetical protein
VVSRLLEDGHIEGVSGVSLPMLLRVLTSRNGSLPAAVQRAKSGGADGRGAHESGPLLRCLSVDAPIVNKLGLHARAAAKLTHLASGFQCEVWISRSGGE